MAKLIPPSAYVQEYFDRDFAPHNATADHIQFNKNLTTTRVPAIQADGLDVGVLAALHNRCTELEDRFQNDQTNYGTSNWYTPPVSQGWSILGIKDDDKFSLKKHNSEETFQRKSAHVDDAVLDKLTQELFQTFGCTPARALVLKLDPGGWVAPHLDRYTVDMGLCSFWIPLHDFDSCMKVFPLGWLKHKYGSMYLFNQSHYLHAVRNTESRPRFVMVGKIDPTAIPDQIQKI